MTDADDYVDYLIDRDFPYAGKEKSKSVTCKHCGIDGFDWKQTDEGWRLFDGNGNKHLCPKFSSAKLLKETPSKPLTKKEERDIIEDKVIEVHNDGCIIHDSYGYITVESPLNVIRIVQGLTRYLEENHKTAWYLLPGIKEQKKMDDLRLLLSMAKKTVETSEMKKLID